MYGRIYKITCLATNKIYIGKTVKTIEERLKAHIKTSKHDRTYTSYLYNAMNYYGENEFIIELIEECDSEETLNERERFWIKELHTQDPEIGYNIQEGGEGGSTRSDGFKLNEKQLDALEKGRHLPSSAKQKQQLSEYRRNVVVSDETKAKLKEARKHQICTEETRKKMSASHKGKTLPNRSEESRERYRQVSSGRVHIHKGTINKNPKLEDLDTYLLDGWELGYYKQK